MFAPKQLSIRAGFLKIKQTATKEKRLEIYNERKWTK